MKDKKKLFLVDHCQTQEILGKLMRLKIQIGVIWFIHCGRKNKLITKYQHHQVQNKHPPLLVPLHLNSDNTKKDKSDENVHKPITPYPNRLKNKQSAQVNKVCEIF